jgi:hypothetical protein
MYPPEKPFSIQTHTNLFRVLAALVHLSEGLKLTKLLKERMKKFPQLIELLHKD